MASIRKRGSSWQAQVRQEDYPPITKTFPSKADAVLWARALEASIDRAELPTSTRDLKGMTVGNLLRRHEQEVTHTKRGARSEQSRIRQILNHGIARTGLQRLSGRAIAQYRDERIQAVKSASVRRELVILRHVFEVARREWGVPIPRNPVHEITLPSDLAPWQRRLAEGDEARLFNAFNSRSAWYLRSLIDLAVQTGMRRGELLSIRWADLDQSAKTLRIQKTKNGDSRSIPPHGQSDRGPLIIASDRSQDFPVTPNAIRLAWERLRKRAGIEDLRLHDLRHEAVSRFFELGLSTPEVALISGHRDPRMLFRYTHPRPEDVAERLAKASTLFHSSAWE